MRRIHTTFMLQFSLNFTQICGFWGTTDTELGSVSSFAGNFASAAAADVLVSHILVSEGDFGVVLGLKLALLSFFFRLPKLYWIPLGCRVIDVGIVGAPDFLLSAVRLQIFLSFIAILYDARHNIVLVVSSEYIETYAIECLLLIHELLCRMCPTNLRSIG